MKKLLPFACAAMMLASCADKNAFEITLTVPEDFRNQTILALNPADGDTLAMATATDTVVCLKGTIEKPVYAFIISNNTPLVPLVVEPGKITVTDDGVTGSPSNDQYTQLAQQAQGDAGDEQLIRNFMLEHPANPYSLMLFNQYIYLADTTLIDTMSEHNPDLASNPNLAAIRTAAQTRAKTAAGNHYVDFTLTNGAGKETSLSSLIDGAPLAIVDFWASWCGPCRALTPDLIELHNKYGAKGLRVVGVDVWERNEEAGPEAAKEMNIPYPILYGGTQETTDLYGIMGIPTVLVIDNAGTIIARDIHGEELNATVANYFEKK